MTCFLKEEKYPKMFQRGSVKLSIRCEIAQPLPVLAGRASCDEPGSSLILMRDFWLLEDSACKRNTHPHNTKYCDKGKHCTHTETSTVAKYVYSGIYAVVPSLATCQKVALFSKSTMGGE